MRLENISRFRNTYPPKDLPFPRHKDKSVVKVPHLQLEDKLREVSQYAVDGGVISQEAMDRFNSHHVTGYMVDGVRVLLIDHEYDRQMVGIRMGDVDMGARVLMNAPSTKAVGIEYFVPELKNNAKRIPHFGPKFIKDREKTTRFIFAENLAEQARRSKKPIFLADTANSIASAAGWFGIPVAMLVEASVGGMGALLHVPFIPEVMKQPELIIPALIYLRYFLNIRQIASDGNRTHPLFQRFGLSIDDSRRVFIAAGIKQMAKEIKNKEPQNDDKQIVVIYPKAHTLPIGDYLEHPNLLKQLIYRMRLDIFKKSRVYELDKEAKGVKKDKFEGWRRVMRKNIPLVY